MKKAMPQNNVSIKSETNRHESNQVDRGVKPCQKKKRGKILGGVFVERLQACRVVATSPGHLDCSPL